MTTESSDLLQLESAASIRALKVSTSDTPSFRAFFEDLDAALFRLVLLLELSDFAGVV